MHGFMHTLIYLTLFIHNRNSPFQTVAPLWSNTWPDGSFLGTTWETTLALMVAGLLMFNHKVVSILSNFIMDPGSNCGIKRHHDSASMTQACEAYGNDAEILGLTSTHSHSGVEVL